MTEKQFLASIVRLAGMLGYLVYHTWSSLHSARGFPDLVLVRDTRLIFAELKSEKGKLTSEQMEWIEVLKATGKAEIYVWWPSQIDEIAELLKKNPLKKHPEPDIITQLEYQG